MSTKTMKQRIALVAVSALTAGLFSVVSTPVANAADITADGTVAEANLLASGSVCAATSAAGTAPLALDGAAADLSPFETTVTGKVLVVPLGGSLNVTVGDTDIVTIDGPLAVTSLLGVAAEPALLSIVNGKTTITGDATADSIFTVNAVALGTATMHVGTAANAVATTANTLTINIVATCTNTTLSAANSRVSVTGTDGTAVAATPTNVDVTTSASAGNSLYAQIYLKNAYGAVLNTGTLSVSATNGALVSLGNAIGTAHAAGTVSVATITPDGSDLLRVRPASFLTTSSTTLTITHNGNLVTTKTVTFRGEAASIEILSTTAGKTGTSGANTTTGFFAYQYKDTAGNVVDGTGASIDSSTVTAVVTNATSEKAPTASPAAVTGNLVNAIETAIGDTTAGVMSFDCSSTAGKSTVTIKHTNAISGASISKTVELSCFGGIDTYTVSTDKASYTVGEVATITITAKDSKGNPAFGTATMGAADTVSVGGGLLTKAVAATDAFTNGVRTYKAQMTTAGTFNVVVSVAGDTTTSATAKYSVTDGATSNSDVLKAIVSLIASINKQIAALQKALLARR
jgi:hypothetical protein